MSFPHIWVVLPTKAKPGKVDQLLQSIGERTALPREMTVVLAYDRDDKYPRADTFTKLYPFDLVIFETPTTGIARAMRGACVACLADAAPDDLVVLLGDDFVIETTGWDDLLRAVFILGLETQPEYYIDQPRPDPNPFAERPIMVFGDDGIQSGRLATHNAFRVRTLRAIDWGFSGVWQTLNDVWLHSLFDLFMPSLLVYVPKLKMTHRWEGENPHNAGQWSQDRASMAHPDAWAYAQRQVDALAALQGLEKPVLKPWVYLANFRIEARGGEVRTSWGDRGSAFDRPPLRQV